MSSLQLRHAVIATAIVTLCLHLVSATTLRQTYADLKEVPQNIDPSTTILDLSHNDITKLKINDFRHLTMLEELWLTGNCLREIEDGAFIDLENLVLLRLENNCLERLRFGMFIGLDALKHLYLRENKISIIESDSFYGLPHPLEVSIWENDLVCDENLREIQDEIDAGNIVIKDATSHVSLVDKFCDDETTDDDLDLRFAYLTWVIPAVIGGVVFIIVVIGVSCVLYRVCKQQNTARNTVVHYNQGGVIAAPPGQGAVLIASPQQVAVISPPPEQNTAGKQ